MRYKLVFGLLWLLWACRPGAAPAPRAALQPDSIAMLLPIDSSRQGPLLPSPALEDSLWLVAVGDLMPATDYNLPFLPPAGGKTLFSDLSAYIQAADLAFANFEGVVGGKALKAKHCSNKKVCFRFRIPAPYLDCIKEAGFDLLNIATNHIDDFGRKGRSSTEKILTEKGFWVAGLQSCPCVQFEKDSLKYGFCAFSPFHGTANMRHKKAMAEAVQKIAQQVDVVIVSLHAGAEGSAYRTQPKKEEIFLKFNRGNLYEAAHTCVDAGADVVIGTGPHVTRAVELYQNRLIMYSLGNFCTYGPFAFNEYTAYAPLMRIAFNKKGEFLAAQAIPIKQIEKGIPRYDSTNLAICHLQALSEKDFPNSPLSIDTRGWILKKEAQATSPVKPQSKKSF